ncbi:MAG TPA: 4-hydroxy-tetrahydrodipicolinate synthase [Myxococcota bacterium]|nr:4-hydroxy-tetrahydrodipicolinate synthase [Myxococcota bacterium]
MFEGVLTALVTPFRDGAVDERVLAELVELQVAAGVDGVVPCGSTGEAATLTHAEHRRVVEVVVSAARGRVQVLAGTGSNSTAEAVELTRHAKEAGADGALLISPYYNKPTQEGIVAHYAEVARQTAFPLVVYNIPGRTASNILPGTLARLAEIEQVVGVKEACGNLDQMAHVIAAVPDDFAVLSGDDSLTLPLLAIGGKGVIATAANVVPAETVELVRAFRAGDVPRARELHYRLLPLVDALFTETNPIPVKAALALRGLILEELRLPLVRISPPNRERLQSAMKDLGLL